MMNRSLQLGVLVLQTVVMGVAFGCDARSESVRTPEPVPPTKGQAEDASATSREPLPSADDQAPTSMSDADAAFAALLKVIVTEDGLVRYDLLAQPERMQQIERVVKQYQNQATPDEDAATLAFWCNAYNANVLYHVSVARQSPGFESVIKIEGFFDRTKIYVGGETITLNDLENKRIRSLHDARIHAALVCAAMSCPPLRDEPFVAERLDAQFDDQCRRWVNDPTKWELTDDGVALSQIFKWYEADFKGEPWNGVLGFVRHYADAESALGRRLAEEPAPSVEWMEYDWSLNDAGSDGGS